MLLCRNKFEKRLKTWIFIFGKIGTKQALLFYFSHSVPSVGSFTSPSVCGGGSSNTSLSPSCLPEREQMTYTYLGRSTYDPLSGYQRMSSNMSGNNPAVNGPAPCHQPYQHMNGQYTPPTIPPVSSSKLVLPRPGSIIFAAMDICRALSTGRELS